MRALALDIGDVRIGIAASDAFGTIALVAMTPTISIQVVGLMYKLKLRHSEEAMAESEPEVIEILDVSALDGTAYSDEVEIIEFSLDAILV